MACYGPEPDIEPQKSAKDFDTEMEKEEKKDELEGRGAGLYTSSFGQTCRTIH